MGLFSKRRRKSRLGSNPLLRWLGPGATTAGLLYAVYLFFVGGFDFASLDGFFSSETAAFEGEPVNLSQETERSQELIRIATFNIEAFGEKKSQTRNHPKTEIDVMGEIAKIVARFDLVAIQEVMSDGISIDRLVKLLNESGGTYAAVVSDPIGDEHRKESYAFIWDRRQIEIVPGSSYIVLDPEDRMYREPMVASFRTLVSQESTGVPFRFTAINVHTDPDEVDPDVRDSEINVLADVFQRVRDWEFGRSSEDDFILLGDLNVPPSRLGRLGSIPGMLSVAGDYKTNVGRSKTNDHILIDRSVTEEYASRFGVVSFTEDLGLSVQEGESISDHLPLFADFSRFEIAPPPRTASVSSSGGTRVVE